MDEISYTYFCIQRHLSLNTTGHKNGYICQAKQHESKRSPFFNWSASLNRAPKDTKISTPMIFQLILILYNVKLMNLKHLKPLNYAQILPIRNSLQNILKVRKTIWEKHSPLDEITAKFFENNDKGILHWRPEHFIARIVKLTVVILLPFEWQLLQLILTQKNATSKTEECHS